MSSSDVEEFRCAGSRSPTTLSSSSSSSSSSDSQDTDENEDEVYRGEDKGKNEDDNSGSVESKRGINNKLLAKRYNGFLRKPRSKKDGTTGRKRQERAYSDSDNSYERNTTTRGAPEENEYFDMEINADSVWGRQTLFENLEPDQVESLVAWAHSGHLPSDDELWWAQLAWPVPEVVQELGGQEDDGIKRNPLLHLVNTPLPLSFLNYFVHRTTKIPEFDERLYAAFDDSALVAIGMIVEEIITASLLPLAGCHVLRCQQLEERPSTDEVLLSPISEVSLSHPISSQTIKFDPRNLPQNETAFSAWTLPPEEAMIKMISQGMVPATGIPLLRAPVRSCGAIGDNKFKVRKIEDVVNQFFEEASNSKTLLTENKELLDLFTVTKKIKRKRIPRLNHGESAQPEEPRDKKPRIVEV